MNVAQRTAGERKLSLLSETAADRPMGKLLRKFWQPVGISSRLNSKRALAVRVLSEDLTLYRGESGKCHLVGGHCLHRLTRLHTGWVEGEQIRCMYHGWKFDGGGHCVERPAERGPVGERMTIAGYPTHEYAGLIFAYLGPGRPPPFDLPRKEVFERPGDLQFARVEIWPCNWFQHVENSLDPVHVSFAHQAGRVGEFGKAVTSAIPELSYDETSWGVRQTATRPGGNVRVSDWTFPNYNNVPVPGLDESAPWIDTGNWMVPVDDDHTARFSMRAVPSTSPEVDQRITDYFKEAESYNAADHHEALFVRQEYPQDPLIRLTSAQDYIALVGQGRVADRMRERLASSDAGIVFLRRLFWRELEAIEQGKSTKQWYRAQPPA